MHFDTVHICIVSSLGLEPDHMHYIQYFTLTGSYKTYYYDVYWKKGHLLVPCHTASFVPKQSYKTILLKTLLGVLALTSYQLPLTF